MLIATLSGNIGGDAETRYTANGNAFLRFNVASNYRTKSERGEWEDATEWVRVTIFGARAESLGQYLLKGTRVVCVGKLESRPWTDQNGGVRAGLEMVASEIDFHTTRASEITTGGGYRRENDRDGYSRPPQDRQPAASGAGRQEARPQQFDDDVDDLPF
jgi:single-strand DNA-binding protein